ncbi:hypothetical protein Ddc_10366 [Ditylenchus destructor]|nr:hypothetical protein Ddc_10366 [Ditylenchus destructor]
MRRSPKTIKAWIGAGLDFGSGVWGLSDWELIAPVLVLWQTEERVWKRRVEKEEGRDGRQNERKQDWKQESQNVDPRICRFLDLRVSGSINSGFLNFWIYVSFNLKKDTKDKKKRKRQKKKNKVGSRKGSKFLTYKIDPRNEEQWRHFDAITVDETKTFSPTPEEIKGQDVEGKGIESGFSQRNVEKDHRKIVYPSRNVNNSGMTYSVLFGYSEKTGTHLYTQNRKIVYPSRNVNNSGMTYSVLFGYSGKTGTHLHTHNR